MPLKIGFGQFGEFIESSDIADSQLGQNLAVDFHAGFFKTVNHFAVRQVVHTCCCIDTGYPQFAEIAFLFAAMSKGIIQRMQQLLIGNSVQFGI